MINYSYDTLTSKEIRIEIGKRLHDERTRADLSLDKLAELTGYSKPTVQRWEKGWKEGTGENTIPTLDQIIDLCAIYKCSPGYLLCEYHDRTTQALHAGVELGLTENTVKLLQTINLAQIDTLSPASADTFMCFLNYFINNSTYLVQLLKDRFTIANKDRIMLHNIPGMEIAKKAFDDPNVQRQLLQVRAYANDDIMKDAERKKLMEVLYEYFEREAKGAEHSPSFLASAAMQYSNHLFPTSEKQSDFIISETFLDIVKKFSDNIYDEYDEYNRFISTQKHKKAELDPEFFSHLRYAMLE